MANQKDDLSRLTLSQLGALTGKTFRTVKARLEKLEPVEKTKAALFYDPKQALPLIFSEEKKAGSSAVGLSDINRLNRAKAEKTELEVEELRKTLIPAKTVERVWSELVSNFRGRMLSLPSRLGSQLMGVTDQREIEIAARGMVFESLNELAEYDASQYFTADHAEGAETDSAAAESDSEPMGGR